MCRIYPMLSDPSPDLTHGENFVHALNTYSSPLVIKDHQSFYTELCELMSPFEGVFMQLIQIFISAGEEH